MNTYQNTEKTVYEVVVAMREGGERTVVQTTHDKSAAETLCRSLSTVPVFQLVGVTAYNVREVVQSHA